MSGKREAPALCWCFTLNNYTKEEATTIDGILSDTNRVRYAIYGHEVGDNTETPHLQGYIEFTTKKRLLQLKKIFGNRLHFEKRKRSRLHAIEYCKKEGDFKQFGTIDTEQGKRTDISAVKDAIDEGKTIDYIIENHFDAWVKYRAAFNDYINLKQSPPKVESHPLRPWQAQLTQKLHQPANSRSVIFVIDPVGNSGKTWFAKWWLSNHPKETQILETEKRADLAYQVRKDTKYFFINVSRARVACIQYDVLEMLKDQVISSPKYESNVIYLTTIPHVVVLMNDYPDFKALSPDRYDKMELNDDRPLRNRLPHLFAPVGSINFN